MRATPLPVSIALAGHTKVRVWRKVMRDLDDRAGEDRGQDLRHADPEAQPDLAEDVDRDDHRRDVQTRIAQVGQDQRIACRPKVRVRAVMRSPVSRGSWGGPSYVLIGRGHHRRGGRHDTQDDDQARTSASGARSRPIVGGLPDVPGIGAAMRLTPNLGLHLRGLADELLVHDFPGATITRGEREMLATAVSAGNDCFFCMDSHGALRDGRSSSTTAGPFPLQLDSLKLGESDGFDPKMAALLHISRTVRRSALQLTAADVEAAITAGASDGDIQLAVLIAAGFSMYNRMVDGLRARTVASPDAYRERADEIAEHGYGDARVTAIPRSA